MALIAVIGLFHFRKGGTVFFYIVFFSGTVIPFRMVRVRWFAFLEALVKAFSLVSPVLSVLAVLAP